MPKTEPTDPISTPATARARRQPARPFSFDAIDFHAKWDGTLRGLQDIVSLQGYRSIDIRADDPFL